VALGTFSNYFYALSSTGEQLWSYYAENSIYGSAAIASDGSVVVGSEDGFVYSFTTPPSSTPSPTGRYDRKDVYVRV
jgi:outer membrane protein assembly factor BamB